MWSNSKGILKYNHALRLSPEMLRLSLRQLFWALDYMHTDCELTHMG